jgi:NADH:ubiquinone oxidoreductase subunit 3 (subunit A)
LQILSSFYIVTVMFIVTLIKNTLAYPASTSFSSLDMSLMNQVTYVMLELL